MHGRISKQTKQNIAAALLVCAVVLIFGAAGITCPIKFITGISCAGCGMTRAWICVLRLDLKGAFYYHPLFWTLPGLAALILLRGRLKSGTIRILFVTAAAAFIAVYLYRLIWGDGDVVVFEPEENILSRILRSLR